MSEKTAEKEWVTGFVDLQFTDLTGRLHGVTVTGKELESEEAIRNGFGKLDGSSINGFAEINESDMVLVPVMKTLRRIPWEKDTYRVLCDIRKGRGEGEFEKDPRAVANRAEKYQAKIGYKSYFGPEIEFFIFDNIRIDAANPSSGTGYKIESSEAPWGEGSAMQEKKAYYAVSPADRTGSIRKEILRTLRDDFGFIIEATHHEVATAGQSEINFRYAELTAAADMVQTLKYVTKNVAYNMGAKATFLPKPMYGDNGSGMHVNFSLWDLEGKKNIIYDPEDSYAEISEKGRYAIGGLLEHAEALSAIVSPTVNSYHRLIPGYEAPVYLAWSRSNRSAIVRIPSYYVKEERSKRIEYRAPDPSANPYLAFPAILMAALDGINKKTSPGEPANANIYHMTPSERRALGIKELPKSLDAALDALEADNGFLNPVFTQDLINTYIEIKRAEAREIARYPTPVEILYYHDV
ncbi:MAG: type I glutamate--ammonia ligase [Candidatus Micrarchaeaceae archaeon]